MGKNIRNKELSWLSFNARLLQEASDTTVPLIERLKFLGIFSSNLDEFFRVRVATLNRLVPMGQAAVKLIGADPKDVLREIEKVVLLQQADFDEIYRRLLKELEQHNIYIVDEKGLMSRHVEFVQDYFREKVRPELIPIMIDQVSEFPTLKDHSIYLAVRMSRRDGTKKPRYSVIQVPTHVIPRFLILPELDGRQYVMLLDDVIRFSLDSIFSIFNFDDYEAYTIKVTRDAELDLDSDLTESFIRKMSKGLKQRKQGHPIRFIYDLEIPDKFLRFLSKRMELKGRESTLIPGARYHNFKDFMRFPRIGPDSLHYEPISPLPHPAIDRSRSLLQTIEEQDLLLHYPYQSFDYVIDFLREASIDPKVTSIKITLYRVAKNSQIINALINAAKNGKTVKVIVELQARFDEEANIFWSDRLREEGVKVLHGVPGLKVHAKMILVTRKIKGRKYIYANVSTGNYNEATARIYSDHSMFTSDRFITAELNKVFDFMENNYKRGAYRKLFVSPFNTRQRFEKLINEEIKNAQKGNEAWIIIKINNLTDPRMIRKLYQASKAGVKIRLMVRGMFSVVPGQSGLSENIKASGLIDRYLEHTRLFAFCHGGEERFFMSSADWMPRNLDSRVEITTPIWDENIRQELRDFLDIHWRDNVKARILGEHLRNRYRAKGEDDEVRAQDAVYQYLREKLAESKSNGIKVQSVLEPVEEES